MGEDVITKLGDFREIIKQYKDLIPDELEEKYKKILRRMVEAKKRGDNKKFEVLITEIQPVVMEISKILQKIVEEVKSKDLVEGEEILWFNRLTKGIFKKRLVQLWAITNKRAFIRDYEKDLVVAVPLNACEVVVMNQHRKSKGTHVGSFTGYAYGGFGGVVAGVSSSRSQSYGDLCFIQNGQIVLRFPGISDPQGVKNLVKTIQKQTAI